MEIRNLYQPFELELLETTEYEASEHKNTFIEMVFVLEGRGVNIINDQRLSYHPDKLLIIFPEDKHSFEIDEKTKLFFIRFNYSYLNTQDREWVQKLEFIFHNYSHMPCCVLKAMSDKPLIRALVEALVREHLNTYPEQSIVITQLINTILTIVTRNILLIPTVIEGKRVSSSASLMINYIYQHIYEPELLKIEALAQQFNVSPTYVSEYFKNQTGQSLQDYIIAYKMKVIESRLRFTDRRVSEIAHELNFTDPSHLNRLFKKYIGVTPGEYRKRLLSPL